jgi:hypothetical protein
MNKGNGRKKELEVVMKNNSKTVAQICKRVKKLGFEKTKSKCLAPIEPSRQMGNKFSAWLKEGYSHTNDAITFLTSSNFKLKRNVKVRRCAVIDGVCWMNWKNTKMQKKISELDNSQPAFSALFLREFLESIK